VKYGLKILTSSRRLSRSRILAVLTIGITLGLLLSVPGHAGSVNTTGLTNITAAPVASNDAGFVKLPLVPGWYAGQMVYYIQTEASDPQVAAAQGVNYVPRLANAITTGAVDDIYVVTNFKQANVIPSAPIPAGPNNADPNYTPLWEVSTVTWNIGTTPHTLHSESEVLTAASANLVTLFKTTIVVNCPVIYTPQGGLMPTARIFPNSGGHDAGFVMLPIVLCWYAGRMVYYIQTEASDPNVAAAQGVNYVPRLANAIAAGAVDDIYVVTNFKQVNVIPSAPIPAGPSNADPNYTPLWQVSTVTWNTGTTPHTFHSESEVLSAASSGLVTLFKTTIVVNCPVMYSPQGGLMPTATVFPRNGS
jgi:hypothetical protein